MTTAVSEGRTGIPAEAPDLRARQHLMLADFDLLDVPQDDELDAATRIAATVSGFPICMINLLDTERACQLTVFGVPAMHVGRDDSLCNRASLIGGLVTSEDATVDPRFADLPWVDGRWAAVRRYASAPLIVDGLTIGTLCLFDQEPGPALTEDQRARLLDLASVVVALLERRRDVRRVDAARTELAHLHDRALRDQAFQAALLDTLPLGIMAADADRRLTLFNRLGREWHGLDAHLDLCSDTLALGCDLFDTDGVTPLPADRVPLWRVFDEGQVTDVEIVIQPHGLPVRTVTVSGARVLDEQGTVQGAVVVMSDITAQRVLEQRLREAALHDGLTGLPNRTLLADRLETALGQRGQGSIAVLYGDLDGFKAVNDQHGHAAGDAVLVEAATRLSAALRPGDTVARIGGDEFVVLCPATGSLEQAQAIAERLQDRLAAPVLHGGAQLRVGLSIGIAVSGPNSDPESLLAAADEDMFRVKRDRRAARA